MKEIINFVLVIMILIIIIYAIGISVMQFRTLGDIAEIESVRMAVKNVNDAEAEDILGQALEINRRISRLRRYNGILWLDLLIPDEWMEIALIDISSQKRNRKY